MMSKNIFIAVNLPPSYHSKWLTDLIVSMDPREPEGGIDVAEIKIYQIRCWDKGYKKLLSKFKTYNNLDHEGGKHRAWKPHTNTITRFIRGLLGLGILPLTPSDPINTPGHVLILGATSDKKMDGVEFR